MILFRNVSLVSFFLAHLLGLHVARADVGVSDVANYASYLNEDGVKLSDLILPFQLYDFRKEKMEEGIRITVVGCVRTPGIRLMNRDASLKDALGGSLIDLKIHPVHSFVSKLYVYRKDKTKPIIVDFRKDDGKFEMNDGDVVLVRAVVL